MTSRAQSRMLVASGMLTALVLVSACGDGEPEGGTYLPSVVNPEDPSPSTDAYSDPMDPYTDQEYPDESLNPYEGQDQGAAEEGVEPWTDDYSDAGSGTNPCAYPGDALCPDTPITVPGPLLPDW